MSCKFMKRVIANHVHCRNRSLTIFLALHESIHAWSGLGAAMMSLFRQFSSLRSVQPTILLTLAFYASVSILHITVPSTISVETITSFVNTSTTATTMPGIVLSVGYDVLLQNSTETLENIVPSFPHLLTHRNVSKLPNGSNGT